MQRYALKYCLANLVMLLFIGGSSIGQNVDAYAGKILPMQQGQRLTTLIDAESPGIPVYFTIRKQDNVARLDVDFTKNMVLVTTIGEHNTDGFAIKINGVREFADRVVAHVTAKSPGKGELVNNVSSYPLDVEVIPKSEKPVFFIVNQFTGTEFTGLSTIFPLLETITDSGMFHGNSKIDTPATRIFTDEQTWQAFWKDAIENPKPVPKNKIDFARQMVVAIFLGKGNQGMVGFRLVKVTDNGTSLTVTYNHYSYSNAPHPSSPFLLIVIPVSKLPVLFQDVTPKWD